MPVASAFARAHFAGCLHTRVLHGQAYWTRVVISICQRTSMHKQCVIRFMWSFTRLNMKEYHTDLWNAEVLFLPCSPASTKEYSTAVTTRSHKNIPMQCTSAYLFADQSIRSLAMCNYITLAHRYNAWSRYNLLISHTSQQRGPPLLTETFPVCTVTRHV